MFDITLICMGKLKEKFYLSAAEEYAKRLKGYCSFWSCRSIVCRKTPPLPRSPQDWIRKRS